MYLFIIFLLFLIFKYNFDVVASIIYDDFFYEQPDNFTSDCVCLEDIIHRKTFCLGGESGFYFVHVGEHFLQLHESCFVLRLSFDSFVCLLVATFGNGIVAT